MMAFFNLGIQELIVLMIMGGGLVAGVIALIVVLSKGNKRDPDD